MAWSVPATAIAGQPFTAVLANAQMRDNLNATAPALATTISSWFTGTGANAIAERIPAQNNTLASSTTTSTSYTNLGDGVSTSVTVATGTSALVLLYANFFNSVNATNTWVSFAVSGATTIAASDSFSLMHNYNGGKRFGVPFYVNGTLTPGNNTFTMKYRVTGNTGTYTTRRIGVIPF
jgi:hypothetical protein